MRRAASVALLLAACGSSGGGHDHAKAVARCREAAAHGGDVVAIAHACADATADRRCGDLLRHFEDVPDDERLTRAADVCPPDSPIFTARAPMLDTTPPAGPPTLQLHEAEAELTWHGLDLHLAKDCGTLRVALDTAGVHDELTLKVDKDVVYSEVLAVMDCVKTHVPKVSLEEVP